MSDRPPPSDGRPAPGAAGSGVAAGPDDDGPDAAEPAAVLATPTGEAAAEEAGGEDARGAARRARRRRRRRRTLLVLGALALVVIGLVAWYEIEAHPFGPPGPGVVVRVPRGEPIDDVVSTLAGRGVIGSSLAFRVSFFLHGTPTVEPGSYLFHQNQSFSTVRAVLGAGPDVFPVTVYPGYTVAEVAKAVGALPGRDATAFEKTATNGAVDSTLDPPGSTNLEGLLGSGIYLVLPGETDRTLLTLMVTRFEHQAAHAGLTPASASALGLSEYQVVVAASIVQKEGYIEKNMGPVARVIYNRLAKGTALQMDSTVLYSIGQDGGPVTKADLALDTPYNTYLHAGLPPTPICIPGPAALRAAVHPTPGTWLYFTLVAKDGTEAFADTYAEQLANEALATTRGLP